ncbi:hypothetical protein Bca4012_099954 [Brassica carinata]
MPFVVFLIFQSSPAAPPSLLATTLTNKKVRFNIERERESTASVGVVDHLSRASRRNEICQYHEKYRCLASASRSSILDKREEDGEKINRQRERR